jgi:multidrug efflux pump subunit AcrA (membrane-fusion protein)
VISSHHSPVRKLSTLAAFLLVAGCGGKNDKASPIATQAVQRRDIVIDASATGVVEPINVVEVKSKASGMITKMPVETGTLVKPGDLLVQIETRDVQNQYDQAAAALDAARSRLAVADAAKKRADELFKGRIITAAEHETAQLDYANAQSALVAARTNLDLNKQRLEDATVRAPVAWASMIMSRRWTGCVTMASPFSFLPEQAAATRSRAAARVGSLRTGCWKEEITGARDRRVLRAARGRRGNPDAPG